MLFSNRLAKFFASAAFCACTLVTAAFAASGDWNVDASGNWSDAGNWSSNPTVPGTTAGDVIGLTNNISAAVTVTIDNTSRTVGTLNIGDLDDTHGFTLAASGGASLTFDNSGGGATLSKTGSVADVISAPVVLADNLAASIAGPLTISGIISETGGARSITKTGAGTLTLTGANTYSGTTTVSNGMLSADTSNVLNSIGTGPASIAGGATLFLNNTKTTNVTHNINNTFTGTGTLQLNFAAGTTARNTSMPNVTGFNGLIRLSNTGATGDKWNLGSGVNAPNATVQIDSGSTLFMQSGTATFSGISVIGSGNSESRGAIRLTNGTLNGPITLAGNATINVDGTSGTINGTISSGAAGTQLLTLGAAGASEGIFNGVIGGGTGTISVNNAAGTNTLAAANTFTGLTQMTSGILNVASLSDYGVASAIGARTAAQETASGNGIGLHFRGGTLQYTGSTPQSTNRQIRLLNSTANTIDASGSTPTATLSFTYSGVNTNLFENPGTRTLNLIGSNTGDNTFAIRLTNQSTNATSLTKAGAGKWILTGDSSYTGVTTVNGGVLEVIKLDVGGANSSIGASSSAAANLLLGNNTTLRYTGTGDSTNRSFTINGTAAGHQATLDASGTAGAISFTNTATPAYGTTNQTRTLNLTGTNTNNNTLAALIGNNGTGAVSLTKSGAGTWVLSAANTYTGDTTVNAGTLTLSGARTAAAGQITVGSNPSSATLNITNSGASFGIATRMFVGVSNSGTTGTVNQSAGTISFSAGDQLLIGNGSNSLGVYNLSGGTITTASNGNRGVMLGVNTGSSGTFNLSNTGFLNMNSGSSLQIGRSDSAANNTTNLFNQTGGTANVGILRIGGNAATGTGINSTLTLTGGAFTAATFDRLALGNSNTVVINIGGMADVTLPAFPSGRGTSSTVTINFDGGTLRNSAASASYMPSVADTSAFIKNGGAKFNTTNGNITIAQVLQNFTGHTGSLTKEGANTLTLSGASTYTGLTAINGGTLALDASGSINNTSEVALGGGTFNVSAKGVGGYTVGTLTGNGSVLGSLTVSTELAIGTSPGTINFENLTLGSSSTFNYELTGGGSTADLGDVSGNLNLGSAALDLVQLGTYTLNDKFTLFAYDSTLTGTFLGLADGDTFTDAGGLWKIDYNDTLPGLNGGTGNLYVTITAVPEPSSLAMLAFGMISLWLFRKRKV